MVNKVLTSWRSPGNTELTICQILNWRSSELFTLIQNLDILIPPPLTRRPAPPKKEKKLTGQYTFRCNLRFLKHSIFTPDLIHLFISTRFKCNHLYRWLISCGYSVESVTGWMPLFKTRSSILNGDLPYITTTNSTHLMMSIVFGDKYESHYGCKSKRWLRENNNSD